MESDVKWAVIRLPRRPSLFVMGVLWHPIRMSNFPVSCCWELYNMCWIIPALLKKFETCKSLLKKCDIYSKIVVRDFGNFFDTLINRSFVTHSGCRTFPSTLSTEYHWPHYLIPTFISLYILIRCYRTVGIDYCIWHPPEDLYTGKGWCQMLQYTIAFSLHIMDFLPAAYFFIYNSAEIISLFIEHLPFNWHIFSRKDSRWCSLFCTWLVFSCFTLMKKEIYFSDFIEIYLNSINFTTVDF